jgi:hypothetical protein
MFRDAASIREAARERRFAREYTALNRTATRWYDGTLGSCDARLAKIDALLAQAQDSGLEVSSTRMQQAGDSLRRQRVQLAEMRHEMLFGSQERVQAPSRHAVAQLLPRERDTINLEARKFMAEQNVTDRTEIVFRARRYASDMMSASRPSAARDRIIEGFVGRCVELTPVPTPARSRTAARPAAPTVADFDDSLLTL